MRKKVVIKWPLMAYDLLVYGFSALLLLVLYGGNDKLSNLGVLQQVVLSIIPIFTVRILGKVYNQIWRYGGIQCYIRLLGTDAIAFIIYAMIEYRLPVERITFSKMLSFCCINLLGSLAMRMVYRYAYKCGNDRTRMGKILNWLLLTFGHVDNKRNDEDARIKIAIVGAGRVGVALAEELLFNEKSTYAPRFFIDNNKEKIGRSIHGVPVIAEDDVVFDKLKKYEIQEIVFAVPNIKTDEKKNLYYKYTEAGYKVKVYDYPNIQNAGTKPTLREFDIEELLFRRPIIVADLNSLNYYKDKTILITGGGGSIGSELCRQLAEMKPSHIVILDIYENGAYDIQQELKMKYGMDINVSIEICSITNQKAIDRVFNIHRPDIVIHAAAHKHVPLMEHNVVEAVTNNIFGTKIVIDACEKYGVERFMMVSTDKAVNPTNVMGATKRMCELIVLNASTKGSVKYSITRFGNVLGSAGSVIPLFKKQIAHGGPITITDKRIIRYFMTIPEASQLVLQSGAMAKNGELFVLDMGKPVKIYDLAQSMIQLSGVDNIEIVETGLRPGEKLYEELLVKTEEMDKTDNQLIFIERDVPLSDIEIERKLSILRNACNTGNDDTVRMALRETVPTFVNDRNSSEIYA